MSIHGLSTTITDMPKIQQRSILLTHCKIHIRNQGDMVILKSMLVEKRGYLYSSQFSSHNVQLEHSWV